MSKLDDIGYNNKAYFYDVILKIKSDIRQWALEHLVGEEKPNYEFRTDDYYQEHLQEAQDNAFTDGFNACRKELIDRIEWAG